jgi:hypothetical protein
LYAADVDMMFCKYRTVKDKRGDRRLKLLLNLEIKTYGAMPDPYQQEVLYLQHQASCTKSIMNTPLLKCKIKAWHFGWFVLRIDGGDSPSDCTSMAWHTFGTDGNLVEHMITEDQLASILRFDIAPDNFEIIDIRTRRHHCKEVLTYIDRTGIFAFTGGCARDIVRRS